MLASSRSWELIAYWAVWFAVMLLPRFLYRGERQYEAWEIYAAHPQYARVLRLRPYVTGAFAVPLLAGVLYVLYLAPGDPRVLVHLAGLLYGGVLILDASLAWHTGIRPLSSFGPRRFAIEEQPSWRTKLMMRIAFGYCAVALALLSAAAW
jgi:hypothetical protein